MTLTLGSRHIGDDDLLRYIDRQLDREALRRTRAHLGGCAECAARLDAMQHRSDDVGEWLALLGGGEPDLGRKSATQEAMERARFRGRSATSPLGSRAAMLAAAASMVLLFVGMGTEAGRAWISPIAAAVSDAAESIFGSEERGTLARQDGPAAAGAPKPASAPAAAESEPPRARSVVPTLAPGTSAVVRFTVDEPVIMLRFERVQRRGEAVVLIREGAAEATAQVTSGLRGEALIPTERGLHIRNRADSQARYEIVVPAHFRRVIARVGDGPWTEVPVRKGNKLEGIYTLSLQASALE